MKILYFTDTHDMGRNPGSRIDDYHSAIFKKMNEAIDEAIKRDVDAIVHGGDWFNHPKVSNIIYNQHQRMLQKAKQAGIPVFVVPGNHDLFGYSMSTIDQTSIGSFAEAKLVILLTHDKPVAISDKNNITVALYGREYAVDIDHDPVNDYQIDKLTMPHIHKHLLFSHGMLLDKPFHPDVRFTLIKDVATDADYVFNGHYHPGWNMHTIGNTTFVNNGSTGRNEGSTNNLTFVPSYTVIEVDNKGQVDVQKFPYQCAAAGNDIFDRTQLVQQKQHVEHLESFEQTLQDALAYEAFNPKDILAKTKATRALPQSILDETLAAIVTQEQLSVDSKLDNYVAAKTPVQVEWVELINFEAHKKTKIDFSAKGMNAITGPSDSGKSAIVRALRFALYNEPKGADFIRHGTKRATVRVKMSNGYIIERSRTKTSAGEYTLTDPKGNVETFKGFGNTIPIQITNAHQMPKVELATGVERPLNFAYQLDGHFLLSDSAAQRASAIGRLTGVHLVDAAIKEKTKEMRAVTIETNAAEQLIEELTERMTSYEWIQDKEKHLRAIKGFLIGAEKDEEEIEYLTSLMEQRADVRANINEYKAVVAELDYLTEVEAKMTEATELEAEIGHIMNLHERHNELQEDITGYEHQAIAIDIVAIEQEIRVADKLELELDELDDLMGELDTASTQLNHAESMISGLDLNEIERKLSELDTLSNELNTLSSLEDEYLKAQQDILEAEKKFIRTQQMLLAIEQDMDTLIEGIGSTCPLCNQQINDKDLIKHGHGEEN